MQLLELINVSRLDSLFKFFVKSQKEQLREIAGLEHIIGFVQFGSHLLALNQQS